MRSRDLALLLPRRKLLMRDAQKNERGVDGEDAPQRARHQAARVRRFVVTKRIDQNIKRHEERDRDAEGKRKRSPARDENGEQKKRAKSDTRAAPTQRKLPTEKMRRPLRNLVTPNMSGRHQDTR